MYYSNSDTAKPSVEAWYKVNIFNKGYDSYVATGTFCEQAKVRLSTNYAGGNATMDVYYSYLPNFKCATDGNGKGIINSKVGLITYDEVIYAGGYRDKINLKYYLCNGSYHIWTMSPAGFGYNDAIVWVFMDRGYGNYGSVRASVDTGFRPVINLNASVTATGTGTSEDPYVITTN